MYKNQSAPKKWVDPQRRAELQERDRIRQAYYARLEKEKQGIVDDVPPAVLPSEEKGTDALPNEVILSVAEKPVKKTKKEPAVKATGLKRKKAKE